MRDERPLAVVPGWVWAGLALALAGQVAWHGARHAGNSATAQLPSPPTPQALRLASFGEPEALARLLVLYLQGFGLQGLDYARLTGWLRAALELDPRSQYPLFLAARVHAENADASRSRAALEFVYVEFLKDPNRRWRWLAHAALIAKHRLADLPLARRYARALERHTTDPDIPLWASQMEIFILEDMNELEAARIMLGGLLERGEIRDPAEARFLHRRLEKLESRLAGKGER